MQIFQLLRSGIYMEGGGWKPPFHGLLSGVGRGVEAGSIRSMGYAVEGRARGEVRLVMANYHL